MIKKLRELQKNWNLCLVALSWYIFVYLETIVIDLPQGEVGVNLLERERVAILHVSIIFNFNYKILLN